VRWQDLQWVVSGPQRFSITQGVKLESLEGDLEDALLAGQLDALLVTHTADQRKPAAERKLRPLIADPQVAEEAYLRDFGIYPINHVIVMRTDTLSRLPQLPAILYRAYSEAKEHAYKRRLGTTLLPWGARYWTRMFDKFGGDPLPYGLTETNRKVVARLGSYLRDQMLLSREPDLDRLFMPI
jgi:4,5-dihydroxyphthalate decarboxylase